MCSFVLLHFQRLSSQFMWDLAQWTQNFRTQPIWFRGVEFAFHMRYLSVHCFFCCEHCAPSNVDRTNPFSSYFLMSAVCVSLFEPCTCFFQHGYVVIHAVIDTHSSVATRCFSLNVRCEVTVCVGGLSIWLFVWWIGSSSVLMVHVCIVSDWRMNMRSLLLTVCPWRWACRDVVPWPPPIPLRSVCALDIVRSKHFCRVHEAPKSLQQFWWVLSPISMRLLQVFCRNSSFSAKVSQVFQLFGKWHLFIVYGFIGECRRIYSVFGKMDSVLMAWSLNDCRWWVCCVLCHVVDQWIGILLRWCCPSFCMDFLRMWMWREINCDSHGMIPPEKQHLWEGIFSCPCCNWACR